MPKDKPPGKLVTELTFAELRQEKTRCEMMLRVYGANGPAGKGLGKRLHAVERRLELAARDQKSAND